MALHTELEIYRSAFDLFGAANDVVLQMRRDLKAGLGKLMLEASLAIEHHIRAANMTPPGGDREPHLLQVLERLATIETIVRLCRDKEFIPRSAYARVIQHTQLVGKQANGWRKYHKGDAQQRQLPGC